MSTLFVIAFFIFTGWLCVDTQGLLPILLFSYMATGGVRGILTLSRKRNVEVLFKFLLALEHNCKRNGKLLDEVLRLKKDMKADASAMKYIVLAEFFNYYLSVGPFPTPITKILDKNLK